MAIHHLILSGLVALSYLQSELQTEVPNLNSTEWAAYKQQFGKSYPSQDVDSLRKLIFFANKLKVDKFNREHEHSKAKTNHLSDRTEEELNSLKGFRATSALIQNDLEGEKFLQNILKRDVEVPDELDWRKTPNRVSDVQDQGYCGSCWAFSAIGALEGQEIPINKSKLAPLSAQNLVHCAERQRKRDPNGCNGGLPIDAFNYVKTHGIETDDDYLYEGSFKKCRFNSSKSFMRDNGGVYLPTGDEETLKQVVAKFGPVSVGIQATDLFMYHGDGVLLDEVCGNEKEYLNHGVLVVGYGYDKQSKLDYWLVKNSWSETWGQDGYIMMARNHNNNCGIATAAIIPKL